MNSTEFRRQVCYPVYVRLKRLVNSPLHLPLTLPPDEANRMIYEGLTGPSPLMVGRFGSVELCTLIAYLNAMELNRVQQLLRRFRFEPIGFTPKIRYMSCNNAGFFPPDAEHLKGFCELMFADMKEVDILGCWRPEELRVRKYLPANLQTTKLGSLEPFTFKSPWSAALAGKKVLVIHPFKKSILRQYERREKLFANPEILPDFDLRVIAAVQSMGGVSTYKDWFEALDSMKQEIDQTDYDIALIGAGA